MHPLDLLISPDHTTLDILHAINVTSPTPEHFTRVLKLRKEAKEKTLTTSNQLEQLRQISLLPQETITTIAIRWQAFYKEYAINLDSTSWSLPLDVFIHDVEHAAQITDRGDCILEVRASESID